MRKNIFLALALSFSASLLNAQKSDYKVVFDLTSKDSIDQKAAIRWISEVTENNPDAQVEIVTFGLGTALMLKEKSIVGDAVTKLAQNKNVSFKICSIAMKNQHLDNSMLLPGVQTVPDGIYEIISKQREGWGYIKVAH
ncbi:MAG TPA: DsrE family protein [Puia sp.]|nr:DsrE family protein [Puia sp.]